MMNDPGPGMRRLEPETQSALRAAIEPRPQSEQFVNPVRAFTCKDTDRLGVGQPIAGG